eukprot:gnl/Spiro4/12447_TR6575_c0_g1_i1.p1 gnl/Spiro4/12447_TR6575_c0_g1~~gnl/Spiro4/12447_TR6575_c0_g1_i1.p1  ORF type:complete len:315 (-),score=83.36 gnl/Spiro4/12447_TR6575_c0_g1_i1:136-1041(-)
MAHLNVDCTLDDLIQQHRTSRRGRGGLRGRGGRGGPVRRTRPSVSSITPYSAGGSWEHDDRDGYTGDLGAETGFDAVIRQRNVRSAARTPSSSFQQPRAPRKQAVSPAPAPAASVPSLPSGPVSVHISNLHTQVTAEDLETIFGELGASSAVIHFGADGVSLGTGEMHFASGAKASVAIKKYNGVELDGKPMSLAVIGGAVPTLKDRLGKPNPVRGTTPVVARGGGGSGGAGGPRRTSASSFDANSRPGRSDVNSWRGGGRGGGRGGRGRERRQMLSAEDLDAQLDSMRAQAKSGGAVAAQ